MFRLLGNGDFETVFVGKIPARHTGRRSESFLRPGYYT